MEAPFTTSCDAFLDGRIQVRQPQKGFRSGLDAVFLAAACPANSGDSVLEAGCGAGVASLCLLARLPGVNAWGVEIDPDIAALARDNAAANGSGEAFTIVTADISAPWAALEELGLKRDFYDHVIANPPFFTHGHARLPRDGRNARSRAMPAGKLDAWLRFLAGAARPGGTATLIHSAEALPELLNAFEGRFGGLRLVPLHPKDGEPAIRVIATGIKGSRAPLSLSQGIVLHEQDGKPASAAKRILREGQRLF